MAHFEQTKPKDIIIWIIGLIIITLLVALPGMIDDVPRDNSERFDTHDQYDPGY
jgi:hypothetical protein